MLGRALFMRRAFAYHRGRITARHATIALPLLSNDALFAKGYLNCARTFAHPRQVFGIVDAKGQAGYRVSPDGTPDPRCRVEIVDNSIRAVFTGIVWSPAESPFDRRVVHAKPNLAKGVRKPMALADRLTLVQNGEHKHCAQRQASSEPDRSNSAVTLHALDVGPTLR